MSSKSRKFKLDDGSVWTTQQLMDKFGMAHSSAYARLTKSTDPAYVLMPPQEHKTSEGCRLYVLDDGSEWTSRMVAKHTGCLLSTAATRLCTYTDPAKVLAPPKGKLKEPEVKVTINERMYFDPLGHWNLINRCT